MNKKILGIGIMIVLIIILIVMLFLINITKDKEQYIENGVVEESHMNETSNF